ncbi:MAG: CBS domain-containing protein [Chloroflexi bacterium]|nr:CBS domain-containing protein [Ardenticatenaceae bacterium]MBL1130245.1 CBS domain-containing protein [Chloroflexota bacterium]NOG36336.1 CBS domain-containing protein [Chloroflexota bacterium]GIK56312.1 MAG: hypothetical protein BroJett015_19750 [Chloroflexota bacterium]
MRLELVKDWMTREVITAVPHMGVLDAGNLMRDKSIRRLPVVDADGRLLGILTHGDVREAKPSTTSSLSAWELNYLLARLTVADIMTRPVLTTTPETTIGEAAQIMYQHKISGLPVLDNNDKLVGILTESDIFRMVVHDWQKSQDTPTPPYAHYEEG